MKFIIIIGGAKLVSLNEKQRGFPCGLRVMASEKYDYCLLEIKASLEEARINEGCWMQIHLMEVWGCGGVEAAVTQQRVKEWESKEILRRRKVIWCVLSVVDWFSINVFCRSIEVIYVRCGKRVQIKLYWIWETSQLHDQQSSNIN